MNRALLFCAAVTVNFGCQKARQPPPATAAAAPSFRRDILPTLERTCLAEGCHGNKPTESVHLDLRASVARAELVNRPAEARKGALRVKPGDARASFLVDKLAGQLGPQEGKNMPLDENTGAPLDPSPVSRDFVDNVLVPWIADGAKDN